MSFESLMTKTSLSTPDNFGGEEKGTARVSKLVTVLINDVLDTITVRTENDNVEAGIAHVARDLAEIAKETEFTPANPHYSLNILLQRVSSAKTRYELNRTTEEEYYKELNTIINDASRWLDSMEDVETIYSLSEELKEVEVKN